MGLRRYLEKFLDRFMEGLGFASGVGLVVVLFAMVIAYALQDISIDEATARSFALILISIACILLVPKISKW